MRAAECLYETTKKNEQNHRRKGGLSRDVIEYSEVVVSKTVDGNENLPISEIGLGTISWGDGATDSTSNTEKKI